MKLSLLLYILSLKLKGAAKKNRSYRNHIGIVQARILIRTEDGKQGRLFVFDRGNFSSFSGARHESDAALVWSDPGTAFRVMTSKESEADTFRAAADGKMRVEGMVPYIQWFTDGIALVMGQNVDQTKKN